MKSISSADARLFLHPFTFDKPAVSRLEIRGIKKASPFRAIRQETSTEEHSA